jgi:hypothetical protein
MSDYLDYGEGSPEISDVQSSTGLIGGSVSVCVQFPYKKKYSILSSDGKHKVLIFGERSVLTLGQPVFKRKKLGRYGKCQGVMTAFRELQRLAPVVQACETKGERHCAVTLEGGRRGTFNVRNKSNQPVAPRDNPPS